MPAIPDEYWRFGNCGRDRRDSCGPGGRGFESHRSPLRRRWKVPPIRMRRRMARRFGNLFRGVSADCDASRISLRLRRVRLQVMRWELLVSFLSAALIVQLVPGPGMLFILANGIAGGRRAGIAAACGAATGMVVHTFAAALG